jgi:hypothetical protein
MNGLLMIREQILIYILVNFLNTFLVNLGKLDVVYFVNGTNLPILLHEMNPQNIGHSDIRG